jgi:phosphoadenosine phosphosulfate reductase
MPLEEKIKLSLNIIDYAGKQHPQIFMSFSGGKDSTVLWDLAKKVKGDIKVIVIDTGYEFDETKEFTDRTLSGYNYEYLRPTEAQHNNIMGLYAGEKVRNGQWFCCAHKEPALSSFLNRGEYDAWITGLRSDETENRRGVGIYQYGKILKVNPIIFWTVDDIWQYLDENKLDRHPLYAQGYKSLGCKPCTEAGFREGRGNQGQFENVGLSGERGADTECGIHL